MTIQHSKFSGKNNSQTPLIFIESKVYLISSSLAFNEGGSYYDRFQFTRYLSLKLSESFSTTVGGAVIVKSTILAIEKCTFHNNSANIGGAIFSVQESKISITNSVFAYNYMLPIPTADCALEGHFWLMEEVE